MKLRPLPTWLAVVLSVTVASGVLAVTLFVQTVPPIPAADVLKTNCTTLVPNVANVTPGTNAYVLLSCGTKPAFNVLLDGVATPRFGLAGTGYALLYVYNSAYSPYPGWKSCAEAFAGRSDFLTLLSGSPVHFLFPNTSDNYCANYFSAPGTGLGGLDITWEQ